MSAKSEIERIARLCYGGLVAKLAARTGSVTDAEDALSEALLRALDHWQRKGLPPNPEAWLLKTAGNQSVDQVRRTGLQSKYQTELNLLLKSEPDPTRSVVDPRIGLMYACAHPSIEPRIRAPLMLQTVLGLDVRRMAAAYLVSPGTLGQRLSRAKRKIELNNVPMTLPDQPDTCDERLDDILAAIYAAYAVGSDGTGLGDDKSSELAKEALWLVSTICDAFPNAAEAHGLFALILFTEARIPARRSADGRQMIPLHAQDSALWRTDYLIDAEQALSNAQANLSLGRFQLEAAIQAVHAARRHTGTTDWTELEKFYRGLVHISPTLGALTSQAAVAAEVEGPDFGLNLLDEIESRARTYQPWHATKAHLLQRVGDKTGAEAAFSKAIGLSNDPAVRAYLSEQRTSLSFHLKR